MEKTKEEEMKELAEILLKSGLATSYSLAVEKAKEMLGIQGKTKAKHDIAVEDGIDITKEDKTTG